MSFILDALKRSENERQEQAGAEFATVPSRPDAPGTPRWLWVLGVLLAANAAILLGLMLTPDRAPEPVGVDAPLPNTPFANTPSFDDQVAEARRNQPAPSAADVVDAAPAATLTSPPQLQRESEQSDVVATDNLRVTRAADLPTLMELRANGRLQLPDLHVDIHVYNDVPSERFVFINMDKYQEGSRLSAGPVIQEITNDGVILEYQNTSFLLLRE